MARSPVFIVGSSRSGTSILVDAMKSLGYHGFREGNFLPLLTKLVHIVERNMRIYDRPGGEVLAAVVDKEDLKWHIAEVFRDTVDNLNPKSPWFDKTGNKEMIMLIPTLRKLWPESVFIFAKRRAIENVASRLKKFPKQDFVYHCEDWAAIMSTWREIRSGLPDEAYVEIDQQELLQHPEGASEKILGLLRLAPEQKNALLNTFSAKRPQQTDEGSAGKIHTLDTVGWSDEEKIILQDKCGVELRAYGYSLDSNYWNSEGLYPPALL